MDNQDSFFQQVYQLTRLIPRGRVCTYGAIAKSLGAARSARMVGWAMNNAHGLDDIPAHRVVNRNGQLTGKAHFNPPELMQQLLENEGIEIKNDTIVDFKSYFWDPATELNI